MFKSVIYVVTYAIKHGYYPGAIEKRAIIEKKSN